MEYDKLKDKRAHVLPEYTVSFFLTFGRIFLQVSDCNFCVCGSYL